MSAPTYHVVAFHEDQLTVEEAVSGATKRANAWLAKYPDARLINTSTGIQSGTRPAKNFYDSEDRAASFRMPEHPCVHYVITLTVECLQPANEVAS